MSSDPTSRSVSADPGRDAWPDVTPDALPDELPDAWLVSNGRVLASARLAGDRRARRRGLLGTDASDVHEGSEGALVLPSCRWVHTVGMRRAIEVAYLDGEGRVIKSVHMRPHRVGAPVPRAQSVVEASEGAFARWGLRVGDTIEVRTT